MPKKLLLLVNPYSGSGKSLAACEYLKRNVKDYEFNTIISQYKGHFVDFLQKEDLTQYEKIVIFGGDGTMHEVTNGIAEKADTPPLLLFPCGGGKALNHDINNLTLESSLQKFHQNNTKQIDIFKVRFPKSPTAEKIVYGFNIIGWGLVSHINLTAEKFRWLGSLRYSVAAIIHIFKNTSFEGKVTLDNEVFTDKFSFVLACNTQHTGKAMKIAPLAALDDGLLDVLVIRHVPFYHLLRLFPLIFSGKHIHSPLVIYKKAKKFSIEAEPMILVIDGEVKGETPFVAEVLGRGVRMIV